MDAAIGWTAAAGVAARIAADGRDRRVSTGRFSDPQGQPRRRPGRHLQPAERETEGLHRQAGRAHAGHLDRHGVRDDQRARENAHRARPREHRLQRRPQRNRFRPARAGTGLRQMSRALAGVIHRWRFVLCAFIVLGALALTPRANIAAIDNDITAWFSKEDPVYRDYERFRAEFAGTRALIVALQAESADRLFSTGTLTFIKRVTEEIERVDTVQRVYSLATATIVEALPPSNSATGGQV